MSLHHAAALSCITIGIIGQIAGYVKTKITKSWQCLLAADFTELLYKGWHVTRRAVRAYQVDGHHRLRCIGVASADKASVVLGRSSLYPPLRCTEPADAEQTHHHQWQENANIRTAN
ncbi:hypothetical protein BaRGS_00030546 [Batillaria attramentaria]|uniref:Secreted protein n=1 Tax=Batillaria attramentaria TaxID=370345 RepID=A0ABD0JU79_9CAEN